MKSAPPVRDIYCIPATRVILILVCGMWLAPAADGMVRHGLLKTIVRIDLMLQYLTLFPGTKAE